MGLRISGRLVIPRLLALDPCTATTSYEPTQTAEIDVMSCNVPSISFSIAQGEGRTFKFTDSAATDFSGVDEITFDIWTRKPGKKNASKVFTATLTGGAISLLSTNSFSFMMTAADCLTLPLGDNWCETWVTPNGSDPVLVGAGTFSVTDTRKFDA